MTNTGLSDLFPIEKSEYYKFHLAEQEQIMNHKYWLSQESGYDVGYERALFSWVMRHRALWLNSGEKDNVNRF